MKQLSTNWLTEGHIDFEYKKYQLLAYFQQVQKRFSADRLYPSMSQLVEHYQSLMRFRSQRNQMATALPKELKGLDFKRLSLEYDTNFEEHVFFRALEQIMDFAIPKFEASLEEGRDRYDTIEDSLKIFPVGLLSIYKDDGFFILNQDRKSFVFRYEMKSVEIAEEKHKSLSTSYIGNYTMDYSTTLNSIRKDLIAEYNEYDNPATYVIETNKQVPIKETFLPVAKRSFIKYLLID